MRPSGVFSATSSSQPGLIGSGHMGAGDTYDLPVAVTWYRRRLTESSSSRATKNSSSRSRRNWGFTRNWPTTPNKRTKPRGVHTEKDKEMIIRFNSDLHHYIPNVLLKPQIIKNWNVPKIHPFQSIFLFFHILIHPIALHYNEYTWSITGKHNTSINVIQCYMFWIHKPSSGITLQTIKKHKYTCSMH